MWPLEKHIWGQSDVGFLAQPPISILASFLACDATNEKFRAVFVAISKGSGRRWWGSRCAQVNPAYAGWRLHFVTGNRLGCAISSTIVLSWSMEHTWRHRRHLRANSFRLHVSSQLTPYWLRVAIGNRTLRLWDIRLLEFTYSLCIYTVMQCMATVA